VESPITTFNNQKHFSRSLPPKLPSPPQGTILAGFGAWRLANLERKAPVHCIEYAIGEEEILPFILRYHRPRRTWNAFVRISLARGLKFDLQQKALDNMRSGGIGIMTLTPLTRAARSCSRRNVRHRRWAAGFLLRRMRNACFTTPANRWHVPVAVIGPPSNGSASAGVPFRRDPTRRSPSPCPIHSGAYLLAIRGFAADSPRSLPESSGVMPECATALKLAWCRSFIPSTGSCCLSRTCTLWSRPVACKHQGRVGIRDSSSIETN
jgi:hypothetical protein